MLIAHLPAWITSSARLHPALGRFPGVHEVFGITRIFATTLNFRPLPRASCNWALTLQLYQDYYPPEIRVVFLIGWCSQTPRIPFTGSVAVESRRRPIFRNFFAGGARRCSIPAILAIDPSLPKHVMVYHQERVLGMNFLFLAAILACSVISTCEWFLSLHDMNSDPS